MPLIFFKINSASFIGFLGSISRNNMTNPKTKRFIEISDKAITGPCNFLYKGEEGSGWINHYWTFQNTVSYHFAPAVTTTSLPMPVRAFVKVFLNELADSESHFCPVVKEVPH